VVTLRNSKVFRSFSAVASPAVSIGAINRAITISPVLFMISMCGLFSSGHMPTMIRMLTRPSATRYMISDHENILPRIRLRTSRISRGLSRISKKSLQGADVQQQAVHADTRVQVHRCFKFRASECSGIDGFMQNAGYCTSPLVIFRKISPRSISTSLKDDTLIPLLIRASIST
jgi:hypothetical protein